MASSKSRQRELARARYHRQLVRKAAAERRRRQIWASVATGVAVLLVVAFAFWQLGVFSSDEEQPAAADVCFWTPKPADGATTDVGTPPTSGMPTSGTRPMNITFAGGLVETELDLVKAPCAAASFAYLAGRNFFDNTKCHKLLDQQGTYALQCGDPSGTGQGGPAYAFTDEYLPEPDPSADPSAAPSTDPGADPSASPAEPTVVYPKGTLAMANPAPNANGSQFFIFYQDSRLPPKHTIFGKVTSGLDVIEKIAAAGTVDNGQGEKSMPANDVVIQSLTVGEAQTPAPPDAPAPTAPPPSVTPSATASAAPKS